MTRVNLLANLQPGSIEVFVNIRNIDDSKLDLIAVVDTGAEVSMFPKRLLDTIAYDRERTSRILIERAGILILDAIETYITISLEDTQGNITRDFAIRAWFADSKEAFIGFDGILDRAILHLDYLEKREGWIEIA